MAWFIAQFGDLIDYWKELLAKGEAYNEVHNKEKITVATLKRDISVMVTGIAFLAIGVIIVAELDSALPVIDNTGLSSDYETTLENFGTGLTLVGLAFIIVPAISILQRMDVL